MTLILTQQDVEDCIDIRECVKLMEQTFFDLGERNAVTTARRHSYLPLGQSGDEEAFTHRWYLFKSMDGGSSRLRTHALRISSEIIEEVKKEGQISYQQIPSLPGRRWMGLIQLFSIEDGALLSIMPDGHIQQARVGATSAVAADYLARKDAKTVGMLGSGFQAQTQVTALCAVRNIEKIKVYSPNRENRNTFARIYSEKCQTNIVPVYSMEEAVKDVDILVCATNSFTPLIKKEWIQPGMHINTVAYEVDASILNMCSLVALRSIREQTSDHWAGDVTPSLAEVKFHKEPPASIMEKVHTLGDVVQRRVGRTNPDEITCHPAIVPGLSGGGLGLQFTPVATQVYQKAISEGRGHAVPLEWFLQSVHP